MADKENQSGDKENQATTTTQDQKPASGSYLLDALNRPPMMPREAANRLDSLGSHILGRSPGAPPPPGPGPGLLMLSEKNRGNPNVPDAGARSSDSDQQNTMWR